MVFEALLTKYPLCVSKLCTSQQNLLSTDWYGSVIEEKSRMLGQENEAGSGRIGNTLDGKKNLVPIDTGSRRHKTNDL